MRSPGQCMIRPHYHSTWRCTRALSARNALDLVVIVPVGGSRLT